MTGIIAKALGPAALDDNHAFRLESWVAKPLTKRMGCIYADDLLSFLTLAGSVRVVVHPDPTPWRQKSMLSR